MFSGHVARSVDFCSLRRCTLVVFGIQCDFSLEHFQFFPAFPRVAKTAFGNTPGSIFFTFNGSVRGGHVFPAGKDFEISGFLAIWTFDAPFRAESPQPGCKHIVKHQEGSSD